MSALRPNGAEGRAASARISDEHLTHLAATHSRDLILVLDRDATVTQHNDQVERLLKYPPSELVGQPLLQFVHPEDRAHFSDRFERLTPHPVVTPPPSLEVRLARGDGQWAYLDCTLLNRL